MLVPAHQELEELFRNRPRVNRVLSLVGMDRAIAAAVDRADTVGMFLPDVVLAEVPG